MSGPQKLVSWQNDGIPSVLNHLGYGECRPNATGQGKSCQMNYLDNGTQARLVVQTPKMFAPFGAKEWEAREPGGRPKWDLVLAFKGNSPMMQMFAELIKQIDEANITYAHENQEAFFGDKGKSRDIIMDRYTPLFKPNAKYDPKLSTKLDIRNEQYTGQVYDNHETMQNLSYVTPMCYVQALIEFCPMWVVDKRFGQTVRTIQMVVHRQEQISQLVIKPMETDEDTNTHTHNPDEYMEYQQ